MHACDGDEDGGSFSRTQLGLMFLHACGGDDDGGLVCR